MFPLLPSSERVVPIDGIICTSMGTHVMCTISVAVLHCCPWGLHMASVDCYVRREMAPDKLTTCFVFAVASDNV
jgi:hypothetical protein